MTFAGFTVDTFPDAKFESECAADLGVADGSVTITAKTATNGARRRHAREGFAALKDYVANAGAFPPPPSSAGEPHPPERLGGRRGDGRRADGRPRRRPSTA